MIITYKDIPKVRFPVYALPSSNWMTVDGLVYVDNGLIDDRNMPGDSLGLRRLQTPQPGLRVLNRSVPNLVGILKRYPSCFIDSNGKLFMYVKTLSCKLKFLRIKKVERKEVASLLWVKGIKSPFTIPRPPEDGRLWAGILYMKGLPWLLYEYSTEPKKDGVRKV